MKFIKTNFRTICLSAIAVVTAAIGLMIVFGQEHQRFDAWVLASFSVNILLFFVSYLRAAKAYAFSFDQMFWLFSLFFFGFAPLAQYLSGHHFWNLIPTDREVLTTNGFVLLWSVAYIAGKKIRIGKGFSGKLFAPVRKGFGKCCRLLEGGEMLAPRAKPFLLAASGLVTLYFLVAVGFTNLFSRSTASVDGLSTAMSLLVTHGFKNTVTFVTAVFILDAKRRKKIGWELAAALLFMLIACFPLSMARNMMASFYAGLLILTVDQTRKGRWFSIVILCGLVLVYPAVEIFRRAGNVKSFADIGPMMLQSIRQTYLEAHYDAYQMFISIQRWVNIEGFSYGRQLVGALLFFVPRGIWPDKPYGTGQTAFEVLQQHSFTNVSAPLVSEAYVNFGVIGIVLFGFFLGKVVHKIDRKYWGDENPFSLIRLVYPFSMFMFFFMLRGDLMSSWAYTFAQFVVGTLIWLAVIKRPWSDRKAENNRRIC